MTVPQDLIERVVREGERRAQDKAPEWAIKEAEAIDIAYSTPVSNVRQDIALALSQAYERGQESMRERAASASVALKWQPAKPSPNTTTIRAITTDWSKKIADAIRSLPIEQEGGE